MYALDFEIYLSPSVGAFQGLVFQWQNIFPKHEVHISVLNRISDAAFFLPVALWQLTVSHQVSWNGDNWETVLSMVLEIIINIYYNLMFGVKSINTFSYLIFSLRNVSPSLRNVSASISLQIVNACLTSSRSRKQREFTWAGLYSRSLPA